MARGDGVSTGPVSRGERASLGPASRGDRAAPSPVSRGDRAAPARVLLDAVDLWISAPTHEKNEIRTFCDLVAGLTEDVDVDTRRLVAVRLAKRADITPALARRLAMDDPTVGAGMIVASPVLTSADLVQIMRCGPAHVRLVAERLDLGPEITATLAGRTRPAPEVESAAPKAASPEAAPIVEPIRAATPEPVRAAELAPTPSEPTPQPIIAAPVETAAPASDGLAAFLALDAAGRWRAIQAAATAVALSTSRPRARPAGEAIGPRLFRPLVRGDRAGFVDELATVLRVDEAMAERILADPHGEPLAVALAALGVDERTATSILLLGIGERATLGQMQDLSALAARIGWRAGEQLITAWRGGKADRAETMRQVDPAERRGDRRETAPVRDRAADTSRRRTSGRDAS